MLLLLPSSRWGTGLGGHPGLLRLRFCGAAVGIPTVSSPINPRFSHCCLLQIRLPLILEVPISASTCAPSPGTREQLDAGPRAPPARPVPPLDPAPREPRARTSPGGGRWGCRAALLPLTLLIPSAEMSWPVRPSPMLRVRAPRSPGWLHPASLWSSTRCPDPLSPLYLFQQREVTTEA